MAETLLRPVGKRPSRLRVPRPFVKWVGGKTQLLPELLHRIDRIPSFGRYHEPMMGSAALFFELLSRGCLGRKQAYLSDGNKNLVKAFLGVRDRLDEVMRLLKRHAERHGQDYYYEVRERFRELVRNDSDDLAQHAACLIYLNKTGFNGLYRENRRGEFNVPFGRYKNPTICDERNLPEVAKALTRAKIECRPFASVLDRAKPRDLVYFDPPYVPLSRSSSFTRYEKSAFGETEQRRLAGVFKELAKRGVYVLLSNSDAKLVHELYAAYKLETVMATRAVNSRADRRGKIREALVRSF